MPLTKNGQTGVGLLMVVWAVVGIAAGFHGSWDVVTAMVLSYCLGGVMAGFDERPPTPSEPPEGEL
jgi:hypothetical protein